MATGSISSFGDRLRGVAGPTEVAWLEGAVPQAGLTGLEPQDNTDDIQDAAQHQNSQSVNALLQNLQSPQSVTSAVHGVAATANQINGTTSGGDVSFINGSGKVLAPLAPVLGADQVYNGLHDRNGVDKALDVTGGGASIVSGTAATGATFGGAGAAVGGVALAPLAGAVGGAGAVIGGAKGIYDGVRSGNKLEVAGGGMDTVGGGLALAGVATAQPELILAGGLTCLGALGLEHYKQVEHCIEHPVSSLEHGAKWATSTLSSASNLAAQFAAHPVSSLEQGTSCLVKGVKDLSSKL